MDKEKEQPNISANRDANANGAPEGLNAEVRNIDKQTDCLRDTEVNAAPSSVEAIGNPFLKMRFEGEVRAFARKLDEYIRYRQRLDSVGGATKGPQSDDMSDSRFVAPAAE